MPIDRSSISSTVSGWASSKLGQPQWLSNFSVLRYSSAPQARQA
jgi:hypothetical protein